MPRLKGPVPQVQAKEGPMPQLVKKRCSGWAVLAAGALIASLLAVGAAPAGAAEIKTGEDNRAEQSVKPTFSACVGAANEDAGFTDLGSLDATIADINCLAHYAITVGTTADTFDPDSNVTRSQMALFLYRAAGIADLDLTGGNMMADYGDIADLGEDRQVAIRALASSGILAGRGNVFDPYSDITRAEMAVALVNFVRMANPGLFVQRGVNAGALIISPGAVDYFADARQTVPRAVDTAISYAYELGITTGLPDATFRPNDAVPRRDMASFITRALSHSSSARPIGLSVQSDHGTLHASVRDADHKPVPGLRVDAFYVSAARAGRAFDDAGRCRSIIRAVEGAGNRCAIDRLDPVTNSQGDAQFERLTAARVGAGVTVWVWIGELNDRFDYELDLDDWYEFDQGPVSSPNAADKAVVLPSQATTPHVRFGDSVEFNLQLQYLDDRGTAGSGDDVYKTTAAGVNPGDGGADYDFVYAVFDGVATELIFDMDSTRELRILTARGHSNESPALVPTTTLVGGTETALVAQPVSTARGHVLRTAKETLSTDGNGRLTFHLSTHDPSPASTNDYRTVAYVLIPRDNAPGAPGGAHHGWAVFSEAGSYLSALSAEARFSYDERAQQGFRTGNRVTVAALNQYHEPLGRVTVGLASNRNHDTNADGDFGDEALDRSAVGAESGTPALTDTPPDLIGTVDVVDPAIDGNADGDLDDLGTDINDNGDFSDTSCFDVNDDGDTDDPGETARDVDGDDTIDPNEGCRIDVVPADAIADSADIDVDGYNADMEPNDDVFVSRFPGARATSGRSGTAQFAFSHMYDAGDPHSGNNVGNNRETITATPASDIGPTTPLRKVRGVMRFGVFVAGTITGDTFTADTEYAANSACVRGTYEYYANIVHVDDDNQSVSSSGIPDNDDYAATLTFGDGSFAGINTAPVTFVTRDIAGYDDNGDGDYEDTDEVAPLGRVPNAEDPTREAVVMSGRCAMTTIDWHRASTDRGSGGERDILSGSLDSREIVVHWGDTGSAGEPSALLLAVPRLVRYDDNDVFENLDSPGDIIEIAEFEELLARVVDPSNPDPSSGTLQWRYYDHYDRDDRTLFQIQLTPIGR